MVSLTEENYLKVLFLRATKNEEVKVKAMAEVLSIRMPAETSMMKKLAEKGLGIKKAKSPFSKRIFLLLAY